MACVTARFASQIVICGIDAGAGEGHSRGMLLLFCALPLNYRQKGCSNPQARRHAARMYFINQSR